MAGNAGEALVPAVEPAVPEHLTAEQTSDYLDLRGALCAAMRAYPHHCLALRLPPPLRG